MKQLAKGLSRRPLCAKIDRVGSRGSRRREGGAFVGLTQLFSALSPAVEVAENDTENTIWLGRVPAPGALPLGDPTMSVSARRSSRLVASLVLALCVACDDDSELLTVEGQYIDYRWEPQLTPCGGSAAAMDEAVPWLGAQLGLAESRYPDSSYSWISDDTFMWRHGDLDALGVAYLGGRAEGRESDIIHEIAHLVDGQWRRRGPSFFVEGLAVALAPRHNSDLLSPRLDPIPYIDGPLPEDRSYYDAAGSFVTYLLGRFGPDRFREFTDKLSTRASGEEIREAFAAVYDEDLDDFVADFLVVSECPEDALPLPQPLSCGAPRVPWNDAETWFYARPILCEDDDVIGGYGNHQDSATIYRTIEIPEDGDYTIALYGDRDLSLTFGSCGPCPWLNERHSLREGRLKKVSLAAGLHMMVLSTQATSIALAGVTLTPVHE